MSKPKPDLYDRKSFMENLRAASAEVATWPKWKQTMLGEVIRVEEKSDMREKNCTTHHPADDCREAYVQRLETSHRELVESLESAYLLIRTAAIIQPDNGVRGRMREFAQSLMETIEAAKGVKP
jgi:hypothetical protein